MSIVSHPANDAYRENFDATFGKKGTCSHGCADCTGAHTVEDPCSCRRKQTAADGSRFAPYPADRPPRYNACTEPCDMWVGPCCCGAWHHGENEEKPAP